MYSSVSPIAVIHETTTKESICFNIPGPKVFSYSRIACEHRCGSFWLRLLFIGIHLDPIHVCRWILFFPCASQRIHIILYCLRGAMGKEPRDQSVIG